ncbi:chemotaxis protein CheD [Profundibacter sp.]
MGKTHITQGEFATASDEDSMITTILGSCVSACLWDPIAGVGGMNHILLPYETNGSGDTIGSRVNAMELLINAIIKKGGMKHRLEAKVFGGGKMISRFSDVGMKNGEFVISFLAAEGISCQSQSLGGEQARRIQFWPYSGRARQKLLGRVDFPEETALIPVENESSDLELL